jgi:glycosyltransferase involved in cell wall biosynthesis
VKLLLIAPLPPPATGHSIAAKTLLDALERRHTVTVVNLSKEGFRHGVDSIARIADVARILVKVRREKETADVIYLTISESLAGNIKDLLIYAICFAKLPQFVIHLHGGSIKKVLFDRSVLLRRINKFFLSRLGGAVILGESHREIFSSLVAADRIHIVPNSAADDVFLSEGAVRAKFASDDRLRVLFLSNLIEGKGHVELVEAYRALDVDLRARVQIDFAGAFESDRERDLFEQQIRGLDGVYYHGVVEGRAKLDLLSSAHILCLPTSLFEGQPISILEAYAAGCVVMTTAQGGIPDVFKGGVNGYQIEPKSADSIRQSLERALTERDRLLPIALSNMTSARQTHSASTYSSALIDIVEGLAEPTRSLHAFGG